MANDIQMEDLESLNISLGPTESTRSSPSTTPDISDSRTDYSEHSLNGSGPSTPMATDNLNIPPEMPNVKVYHPYDIEEPDDEPNPAVQKLEFQCLPDFFEGWQRELIEYMNGLGNDPSKQIISKPLTAPRRGQKRKPSSMSGTGYHSSHSPCSTFKTGPGEEPMSVPGLSSKRRRRRSKIPDDSMKAAHSVSLHDFREDRVNGGSSSDAWSTDSSAEMYESAIVDDMDLD
ncbi:uncharacterized protein N7484_007256 [Penicillium longicatenatum]|uniref:uncharacterized protein n=1 Tax=Penicillium longicatenatum TaxID=1561947 RepID=UPI00254940B7|nr:uncharacterized protein N7484_007256 [Penicillium longicatenatum]KAJ5639394.1 hypothetical protein N7484_007256 [Penicillium longicatenatum]